MLHQPPIRQNTNLKLPIHQKREISVNIHRICLTGGACSGRKTALAKMKEELVKQGYKVLVVPNTVMTIMQGMGITEGKLNK